MAPAGGIRNPLGSCSIFVCFSFNNCVSFRYIQFSLVNRVAVSACHLFIWWQLNCILSVFPFGVGDLMWI